MAKPFWFYLIIGEMHILKKSAKCHPRVTSTLFWQIISHYKMVVNIPCLQNICSAVKSRDFEIETLISVSGSVFTLPCF